MPSVPANGIEIFYDTFGSPSDPAIVLIRGFGSQMISWRDTDCEKLANEGFFVVRFDNRDVGLSSKVEDGTAYTLDDMADDTVGLMHRLGIDAAHIVGQSMGGMIAQTIAINHRNRVLSVTSIMSHMGEPDTVAATPEAMAIFLEAPAQTREEAVEKGVRDRRVIAGSGFPFDEDEVREIAALSYDRSNDPAGRARQGAAIRASAGRREALSQLTVPFLVIHGSEDPLIPVENGRQTAAAVPGAELVVIPGMAHDIPKGAWPQIMDAIVAIARRAAVSA